MKLTTAVFTLVSTLSTALAAPQGSVAIYYNTKYDDSGVSTNTLACSDGINGLSSKYPTLGQIPGFPNIGGVYAIGGWNSPSCGTCWKVTYKSGGNANIDNTIYVTGVDTAPEGIDLSQKAMNTLTNGNAQQLGRVEGTAVQVDKSYCGFH